MEEEKITDYEACERLILAVIWRAMADLKSEDDGIRESALSSVKNGLLQIWADMLNTPPDIRRLAQRVIETPSSRLILQSDMLYGNTTGECQSKKIKRSKT